MVRLTNLSTAERSAVLVPVIASRPPHRRDSSNSVPRKILSHALRRWPTTGHVGVARRTSAAALHGPIRRTRFAWPRKPRGPRVRRRREPTRTGRSFGSVQTERATHAQPEPVQWRNQNTMQTATSAEADTKPPIINCQPT